MTPPLTIGRLASLQSFGPSFGARWLVRIRSSFWRAPNDTKGPIKCTNQMYVVGITNLFGLEAWNSYTNVYPRNLQMVVAANMTAILTNELGASLLTSRTNYGVITNIPANTWRG